MIAKGHQPDKSDFVSEMLNSPFYDHCPSWCCAGSPERIRPQPDDGHGEIHKSSAYAPAGYHGV